MKRTIMRNVLSSVTAFMLCCSMSLGSTYAWFTTSVCSTNNTTMAGNLQMEISCKPYGSEYETWTTVGPNTKVFDGVSQVEPGTTEAVWFKVENTGTLPFECHLDLDLYEEISGINKGMIKQNLL